VRACALKHIVKSAHCHDALMMPFPSSVPPTNVLNGMPNLPHAMPTKSACGGSKKVTT
jgi:hypothetical protein